MQDLILVLSSDRRMAGFIAQTLRRREVFCLPMPIQTSLDQVLTLNPQGIIIAASEYEETLLPDVTILSCGRPVLALGASAVAMCQTLGGKTAEPQAAEDSLNLKLRDCALTRDMESGEHMLHKTAALTLPEMLTPIAWAGDEVIGFRHADCPIYGIEYPIEHNDPDGVQLLTNFACGICLCSADWTDAYLIDHAVDTIRKAVPEGKLLCAVSGGVDSAVCAMLSSMAIGERLCCVFVDTGLFRMNEAERVLEIISECLGTHVERLDVHEEILHALEGLTSSEEKEKAVSQALETVLDSYRAAHPEIRSIAVGTNFNDLNFGFIGEGSEQAPDTSLIHPISHLFKEEVRRIASVLHLPKEICERKPFPAAGLALRISGSVTAEKIAIVRKADSLFRTIIREDGNDRKLWQFYASLAESTDFPGRYTVCLRALQLGQERAYAARLPFDVLERAGEAIRSELPQVAKIVYDLSPQALYEQV